ncbi:MULTISPECIES: signal peptidase II [Paenibacillus]|uniref:signal peptidase II n=1 Tax=Paenibacillus TaxID=44249 RepID=UPI00061DF982|nr:MULTISPECIES: signal peptidase II [Paenibacillus]KKC47221.1 signal peptidase II [Paenibacillus sp. D9]
MLFYSIAVLTFMLDQATKWLIRRNLEIGDSFPWGPFQISRYENSGMAGSLFQGYGTLFGIAALLFVVAILYYRGTLEKKRILLEASFGLLVGGAAGNGIDRLLFGRVTDFLVRSGGILNVADHAIEAGVLLLLIHSALNWLKRLAIKEWKN